jgi:hypothetical protein
VFPFIIVVIAYLLIVAMVAIGTVGLNPGAITPMLRAPRQFARLLISRQMRRNHALEHATINVIEQRYGRTSLTGMPAVDGFHLRGRVSPQIITTAAQEAIRRLRRGERHLAINRRCPTSLVSAQLGMAVLFTLALWLIYQFSAPFFLLVLISSALLGPPVSPYLQRFLLVDPKVEILGIRDVEVEEPKGRLGLLSFMVLAPVFVRTAPSGGDRRSRQNGDGEVTLITKDDEEIPAGSYRVRE